MKNQLMRNASAIFCLTTSLLTAGISRAQVGSATATPDAPAALAIPATPQGQAPGYLFDVAGNIRVNALVSTSDARFKQHVRPLVGALAGVVALQAVRYDWNTLGVQHGGAAGAEQVGLLAQEVEKIYPELVSTDKDGYKAVNYAQLTPVLIEALKEQQQQLEILEKQVVAANRRAAAVAASNVQRDAQADAALTSLELRLRALEASSTRAVARQN